MPDIRRYQNEPDDVYLRRVNRLTRESIQESKFETKYGVEVIRNAKSGEISLRKRPDDEFEVQRKKLLKQQLEERRNKKSKKKTATTEPDVVLTVKERTILAKEMLKKRKAEKADNVIVEYKKDDIKFGEIVHAPPHLCKPRLAKKFETVPRVFLDIICRVLLFSYCSFSQPGRKKLLLNSMLENPSDDADDVENSSKISSKVNIKNKSNIIDLKGKRKELPRATREMIEKQQQNAMDAYRLIKKNKYKTVEK